MMSFEKLLEKLRRVEALYARTDVKGERDAAAHALDAIRAQLESMAQRDVPVEFKFSMPDAWSRRLFTALLRRYGIEPYRYRGQRRTTVMARVPKSFVDDILWPEFVELDDTLKDHLSAITDKVIEAAIFADNSEATERQETPRLTKKNDDRTLL
jgi:hypothetical protein